MMNRKRGGPADDERFESIYRQYYARVWRNYRRKGVSVEDAHDLSQDTFQRLLDHVGEIRNPDPWPFLKKMAHRVLLNWIRTGKTLKRSGKMVEIDDPDTHTELQTPEPNHADEQEASQRRESLYREIAGLSEAKQQVVLLKLEGKSYVQIAADLRISMDAVKSRHRDALRQLRSRMRDEPGGVQWPGGDPEEEE
jgi:RNA polymerase sigma factor (sigma-70 family)